MNTVSVVSAVALSSLGGIVITVGVVVAASKAYIGVLLDRR